MADHVTIFDKRVTFVKKESLSEVGDGTEYCMEVTLDQLAEIMFRVKDAWFTSGSITGGDAGLTWSLQPDKPPEGDTLGGSVAWTNWSGGVYFVGPYGQSEGMDAVWVRGYSVPTDFCDKPGGVESAKFGDYYATGGGYAYWYGYYYSSSNFNVLFSEDLFDSTTPYVGLFGGAYWRDLLPNELSMWQMKIGQDQLWRACGFNHYMSAGWDISEVPG